VGNRRVPKAWPSRGTWLTVQKVGVPGYCASWDVQRIGCTNLGSSPQVSSHASSMLHYIFLCKLIQSQRGYQPVYIIFIIVGMKTRIFSQNLYSVFCATNRFWISQVVWLVCVQKRGQHPSAMYELSSRAPHGVLLASQVTSGRHSDAGWCRNPAVEPFLSTGWGRSSLAKLVTVITISVWQITIFRWGYKPTNITGGHHPVMGKWRIIFKKSR